MSNTILATQKMTFRQVTNSKVFLGFLSFFVVLAMATTAILLSGNAKPDPEPKEAKRMPVRVVKAEFVTSVTYQREFAGEVRARRTSDLAFERAAKITSVLVDEGDSIVEGQPIAVLDTADLELSKQQAEAALNNAKAVLEELNAGPRQEVIAAAQADVEALENELSLAEFIMKQREKLQESQSISDEEWRQTLTSYNASRARRDSARQKLEELKNGTRIEKIAAQKALVDQLSAQLALVNLDLKKSTLKAPFGGTVSKRYLDEGAFVAPGDPVLRITENEKLEVIVGVPPNSLASFPVGKTFACSTESHWKAIASAQAGQTGEPHSQPGEARVRRILPSTDERTRLVPIVLELVQGEFKPGQIVRIAIEEERAKEGFWVPTQSLLPDAKGMWSLYVVSQDKNQNPIATIQRAELLFTDGERSLIRGTISDGDLVIPEGIPKITNGQPVQVIQ